MPIIGSYARVDVAQRDAVWRRLSTLRGVSCFELGAPERIGVLVEAESLEEARALLLQRMHDIDGLLGVFPVSVDCRDVRDGSEIPANDEGDSNERHEA